MSNHNNKTESSDFYGELCNLQPCTKEEFAAINRECAEEIRRQGETKIVTCNGEKYVVEPVYVGHPRTDLPDEATMNRMIEEEIKEGWLPYWTHWTPPVRCKPYNGKPASPKPLIFEGIFLGYIFSDGKISRSTSSWHGL